MLFISKWLSLTYMIIIPDISASGIIVCSGHRISYVQPLQEDMVHWMNWRKRKIYNNIIVHVLTHTGTSNNMKTTKIKTVRLRGCVTIDSGNLHHHTEMKQHPVRPTARA